MPDFLDANLQQIETDTLSRAEVLAFLAFIDKQYEAAFTYETALFYSKLKVDLLKRLVTLDKEIIERITNNDYEGYCLQQQII